MTGTIPDLWPEAIDPDPVLSPVVILRQQAVNLGTKTHQIVVGEVESGSMRSFNQGMSTSAIGPVELKHEFFISAPLIGYRVPVVRVLHGLQAYPVIVQAFRLLEPGRAPAEMVAKTPDEFLAILKTVLSDESVLRTIRSLLAFSRDAEPVEAGS